MEEAEIKGGTEPEAGARRGSRLLDGVVRLGVPAATALLVLAVFAGERLSLSHELQLMAPAEARPGERIAARAILFRGIDDYGGGELASAKVALSLRDRAGRRLAEAELSPSPSESAEGSLAVPASARGRLRLHALAVDEDGAPLASVEQGLWVRAQAAPAALAPRRANELQFFAPGPVRPAPEQRPPDPFEVRVEGAICVPEAPCALLVDLGAPPGELGAGLRWTLRLAEGAGASASGPLPEPGAGLFRLELVPHGPEVEVDLVALLGDTAGSEVEAARRALRLPIGLATPAFRVSARVLEEGAPIYVEAEQLGGRPALLVDAFSGGRWQRTGSIPAEALEASPAELPFEPLGPGLWRLQARTDPLGTERATSRFVYILAPGEAPDPARLGADLRAELRALDPELEVQAGEATGAIEASSAELVAAWIFSPAEASIREQPRAVSGHEEDLRKLAERRDQIRLGVALGTALALLILILYFLHRGARAAIEAEEVLEAAAEAGEERDPHSTRRIWLSAMAIVLTVTLAFGGAALLILARAHFLE